MVNDIVGKFAKVQSEGYDGFGLEEGDLVFIAGSGFSPVDEDDNYKLLFVVSKMDENGIPNSKGGITIARKSLSILSDEDCSNLRQKMENAFAEKEEAKSE